MAFFFMEQKAVLVRKTSLEELSDEDPEVKKKVKDNVSNIQNRSALLRLQEITSSWIKMKRILVIKGVCLNRMQSFIFEPAKLYY